MKQTAAIINSKSHSKKRESSPRVLDIISCNYDHLRNQLHAYKNIHVGCLNFDDLFADTIVNIVHDQRIFNAPEDAVLKNFIYKFRMIEYRASANNRSTPFVSCAEIFTGNQTD